MTTVKTKAISELNDLFRNEPETYSHLGLQVSTPGISKLDDVEQLYIWHLVINYDDFTPENDPHGEHDFGAFEHEGKRIFWKIDYYDLSMEGGSPDPSDLTRTTRVLTIMLATEY